MATQDDGGTDLLERKFKKRFSQLDTDGDGFLEREDYMSQAQDFLQQYGESVDSAKGQMVVETYERMWAGHAAAADIDTDGRVSFEEYMSYLMSSEFRDRILASDDDSWFNVCDVDGDGFITLAEFRMRPTIEDEDADQVFQSIDTDGDGLVSKDELRQALRDFFTSSDSEAPGNLFYGRY
ncbi:MAG: EF-hand domain-containing protein [Pseudonocardiaceae bacterium]